MNTLHIPDSYTTKLTTMASANQMPDIGLLNGDVALKWASQSRIYNIMDFLANDPDVAKEMGYVGNALAGSLRSGLTWTIAVIVSDVANPHFGIMVKEIEKSARKHHYTIFVINTEDDYEMEERAIYTEIGKNVDAIIICPSQRGADNIRFLQKNGVRSC